MKKFFKLVTVLFVLCFCLVVSSQALTREEAQFITDIYRGRLRDNTSFISPTISQSAFCRLDRIQNVMVKKLSMLMLISSRHIPSPSEKKMLERLFGVDNDDPELLVLLKIFDYIPSGSVVLSPLTCQDQRRALLNSPGAESFVRIMLENNYAPSDDECSTLARMAIQGKLPRLF